MIAAIFDLDGTLYTGHIGRGIAQHHLTHRTKRRMLYLYLTMHYPLWGLQKAGLLSDGTCRELWTRHMGWLVRGWTIEQTDSAFAWIAEHYVMPKVRPAVHARLEQHRSSGHRLILLSGTPAPLLQAIGRAFAVEEIVGTPLRTRNGRYTGASELPVCQGADKITRLDRYLEETGSIDWSESWAYADSYTDLPFLERVGHPVAVHPDPQLLMVARGKRWEVID
jgi:HAD superfamily hydrolase (TIGR01490 family)